MVKIMIINMKVMAVKMFVKEVNKFRDKVVEHFLDILIIKLVIDIAIK